MTLAVPDYIWLNQVNELKHQIIVNEHAKLPKMIHSNDPYKKHCEITYYMINLSL